MLDDQTEAFLEGDCSLVVGFLTADDLPLSGHAWGAQVVQRDPTFVRVVLAARDAAHQPDPLGRSLALTAADVPTLAAVQVKGRVIADEAPTEQDLERAARHTEELFVAINRTDGEPIELLQRMLPPAYRVWTIEVDEVYDQTPGPGAGAALGAQR